MKGTLAYLGLLIGTLAMSPASAGTLYKCVGGDGIPSYVSKRIRGASCSVVSHHAPARQVGTSSSPTVPRAAVRNEPSPTAVPVTAAPVSTPARPLAPAVSATKAQRVVSGEVYSYIKDGVRHYTSARPAQVASLGEVRTIRYSYIEKCYACTARPGVNFGSVRLNTTAYQNEIMLAAREFGVDEAVVRAIIHAESAFNPTALSRAGAQGLMQLMPPTARRFGVTDSYDASQNIRGGVQYLSWLLKRFNGNLTLAAAGYNAGEGAVDRHGGVPPYKETQYYVQRVAQLADRYRGELGRPQ